MSNKNLENVLLQENVDFEIEQAAVDAQNAAQKEENLENLENNENAQNEESGESGEGLEDYYPYAGVDFKSVRTHRNLAMEQWFGVDENNVLQMANQDDDDDDHHDAVRLPILARFIQKCPRRTKEGMHFYLFTRTKVKSKLKNYFLLGE